MIIQVLGIWKNRRGHMVSKIYTPSALMEQVSKAIDKFPPELLNKGLKFAVYSNPNKKEDRHPDYNLCLVIPELEKKKKDLDPNNVPF